LPINYDTHYALTLPKVTPTAKKPKIIAPNSLADEKLFCCASLRNAYKRGNAFALKVPLPNP
jgi:hypothetical protein